MFVHQAEEDLFTANEKTLVGISFTFSVEALFDNSGNVTHFVLCRIFGCQSDKHFEVGI